MTEPVPNAVELRAVSKVYGASTAVREVSMDIARGAFVTILGPSGCGKSTLLRMISGFVSPSSGDVLIDGVSVLGAAPYERDTAMVFQDYALFPHRTVAQNLAFGLRMRKVAKDEIARRVEAMLELVNLKGFGDRRVSQMSGGQAQRVALGRALIVRPAVLLLDEPLGALDLKLRKQMQAELKTIHRDLGLTFVAVTHDQEEALTLSDRIAVMNGGALEQFDTPENLYRRPATRFVADFVGNANLFDARLGSDGRVEAQGLPLTLFLNPVQRGGRQSGAAIALVVRPETIAVGATAPESHDGRVEAQVEEIMFSGAVQQIVGRLPDGRRITAHQSAALPAPERGTTAVFSWPSQSVWLVDA
ncbi:ABC transporter ATP-binding protein [Ancylobacter vacuolatus]|uniref:Spermidine/putrescine ABC transporter ATP-binding subunit n=1 Tax=Ancylobacter vacuolatus TaxID=223389 RepID=A0ABU0DIP1_9HYPH|nr:ABC transporter ATP-binding protein [Ancylobacter vacuolatus]MDQ0348290.1 spermidine/putrescine ABC transporter ATP-binding subunit [Ancylobacter vacuolatus]